MPKNKLISISLEFYKTSLEILSKTPENWLEFSAGQNTETNLKRFRTNSFFSFVRQSLGYFYFYLDLFQQNRIKLVTRMCFFLAQAIINLLF